MVRETFSSHARLEMASERRLRDMKAMQKMFD
ncbi:hypothetical protein DM49_2233 [Burkholderia mallei]|nr:hypothetical protein DM49_2233 [Burkholderia mallei]